MHETTAGSEAPRGAGLRHGVNPDSSPLGLTLPTRVVVPALRADAALGELLRSLELQEGCASFEVMVAFDGTDSAEIEALIAGFPWVHQVCQSHGGSAAARNLGADGFDAGLLIFVDADMRCDPGFVAAHQAAHRGQRDRVAIGIFPTQPQRPSFFGQALHEWTDGWMAAMSGPTHFDTVCSGNMSLEASSFRRVQGFDDAFEGWGRADSELGVRLIDAGLEVVVEPTAIAQQDFAKAPSAFCGDFRSLGGADVAFAGLHPSIRPELLLSRLHRAPWPLVWLRKLTLEGHVDDLLAMALASLDAAERQEMMDPGLVDLLWTSADLSYWCGVRDSGSRLSEWAAESMSVLVFHDIGSTSMSLGELVGAIDALRQVGHEFVDIRRLCALVDDDAGWPAKGVCLTFDDGLKSHLELGRRLAEAEVASTFFVPTARLDTPGHLGRRDVAELVSIGVDVQMHAHNHEPLTGRPAEQVAYEVDLSGTVLRDLGADPVALALPFGATDRALRHHLRAAGVHHAFCTTSARADRLGDPLDVPRITVPDASTALDVPLLIAHGTTPNHAVSDTWPALQRSRPTAHWEQAGSRDPRRIFQFLSARTG